MKAKELINLVMMCIQEDCKDFCEYFEDTYDFVKYAWCRNRSRNKEIRHIVFAGLMDIACGNVYAETYEQKHIMDLHQVDNDIAKMYIDDFREAYSEY